MFARNVEGTLKNLANFFPVVTVTGPRQSGKTTLVKMTFPEKPYVNLEAPDILSFARADPRSFLSQYKETGAILDEVQNIPELFSYIQTIVDEHDKKGEFILTGSHQFALHQGISQSLAGRVALLSLLPMSIQEIQSAGFSTDFNEVLFKGGYPRIYKDSLDPVVAYRNYYQTYLERDLRALIAVKDLSQFQKFIRLCAGRVGQILNLNSLSNDVGVSVPTIKQWLSVLEASYLLMLVQPYYENFGKRVIKSPKIYFVDVGLVCYLLGIENKEQVFRDPLRGAIFENLIFLELYKMRANQGLEPRLYYYRDQKGFEVDFIFEKGRKLYPIEVKSSETFIPDFSKNIKTFQKISSGMSGKGLVVYAGQQKYSTDEIELCHYSKLGTIREFLD